MISKMADAPVVVVRRNRPGTKAQVNKNIKLYFVRNINLCRFVSTINVDKSLYIYCNNEPLPVDKKFYIGLSFE